MYSSRIALKQRAVMVTGMRTPFTKPFGSLMRVDTVQLGSLAIGGLLKKTQLDPKHIDHVVWGNVVLQPEAHNCAREIIIDLNLPKHITGNLTSLACASGLSAMSQAAMMIECGQADVVIAGGSDSCSNGPVMTPRNLNYGLAKLTRGKKKGLAALGAFFQEAGYNPGKWMPSPITTAERSTGETMGWHADVMAEINKVTREEQEELTVASHRNANEALKKGYIQPEVVSVPVEKGGQTTDVTADEYIQPDIDKMKAKMRTMKPVFRKGGTVTAATSTLLTDGGSAILMMSEEKAKQLGYPTDVSLKSCHFCGIDPYPQLLLAPALGWGPALRRAGLTAKDIDLFEIHEAFAAQVLATIKCLASPEFYEKHTGSREAVLKEKFDFSKLNVNGGSLALGHPFAATGGRIAISLANELRRSGKRHGLISICAAGGLGGVAILEHTPKK